MSSSFPLADDRLTTPGHQAVAESKSQSSSADAQPLPMISVMSPGQKAIFSVLVAFWAIGLTLFYEWWFEASHIGGWLTFTCNTLLITWTLGLPGYFFFFLFRMKRIDPQLAVPNGWRVAMVTTRAPSEPFEVVKKTLEAMLDQDYSHDTWLADEAPTDEIRNWCEEHGVRLSTRNGVAEYHRDSWPRRTKCKEGNLAYFYDHFGYESYEYVVQLDADHVPSEGYLEAMLRPFVDAEVGYVSAPSVCDSNASSSWSARGRLFAESIMHGPLQAGYSNGFAPLCIGSHYAVRTAALKEIGGLGPELAEDHSTTLMMNGHGWRGVHALDAEAHGEGPPSFAACITQEFQWSRSLMVVLLTLLPKYWSRLRWRLRLQFLFSELWYPLFGATMLCGLLVPVAAVLMKEPWVKVNYLDFLWHSLPVAMMTVGILSFLKSQGWLRPQNSPVISWETMLFQVVRWPWAVYGSLMGIMMVLHRRNVVFRVTPKGGNQPSSLDWKVLLPYLAMILISFAPALLIDDAGAASGYFFFLILAQIVYLIGLISIVLIHCHETAQKNR